MFGRFVPFQQISPWVCFVNVLQEVLSTDFQAKLFLQEVFISNCLGREGKGPKTFLTLLFIVQLILNLRAHFCPKILNHFNIFIKPIYFIIKRGRPFNNVEQDTRIKQKWNDTTQSTQILHIYQTCSENSVQICVSLRDAQEIELNFNF